VARVNRGIAKSQKTSAGKGRGERGKDTNQPDEGKPQVGTVG